MNENSDDRQREILLRAARRQGYREGLERALEIAKDYTGQGVLIQADLTREIERQ